MLHNANPSGDDCILVAGGGRTPSTVFFKFAQCFFKKKMVDQSNFEEMELDARILFWRKDTKTLL